MIDRIIKSSLADFQKKFNFEINIKESDLFEHFINYTILESKLEERLDEDALDKINIGKNGTIGLDGFCILINKHLITSIEDLNEILDISRKPTAEVYFIQAKTSNSFNIKEISSFGHALEDFVSEDQKYNWPEHALDAIQMFKTLTNRANELESNPKCYILYATLGNYENDINLNAEKEKILKDIKNQRVFEDINFKYYDHDLINKEYKKIGQKISRTFNFSRKILIPDIDGVKEAYLGVVPVTTIIDLIEKNDELVASIFYDNVRDFQGLNPINTEIKNTIEDQKLKFAFSILNNGITIVAEDLTTIRDNVTITNYQVINGLQTSRVLQSSKKHLDENIFISLKLIITQNEDLISKIIRSTNRQTEVKEEDLIAYSDFQKKLEDYFKTFDEKIYYERRSKQYNSNDKLIDPKLIIDKSTLIKIMGSYYFLKPNLATRYFGALFNEFGENLFQEKHSLLPYYSASIIYKKLDFLFKNNKIDKKYRKIKYFILMMLRLEFNKHHPDFTSKKIDTFCQEMLQKYGQEKILEDTLEVITNKLDSLGLNYSDNELSKSSKLVENIRELYFKEREPAA